MIKKFLWLCYKMTKWYYGGNGSVVHIPVPSTNTNVMVGGNIFSIFKDALSFLNIHKGKLLIALVVIVIAILVWQLVTKEQFQNDDASGDPLKAEILDHQNVSNTASGRVMTLFYTDWCPACKALKPTWKALTDKHKSSKLVAFKTVNCEQHPEAAKQNNLDGIPTIILYKNGKRVAVFEGDRTVESLEQFMMQ